jgi:hypothetical protein
MPRLGGEAPAEPDVSVQCSVIAKSASSEGEAPAEPQAPAARRTVRLSRSCAQDFALIQKKSPTGRTTVGDFRWRFQSLESLGFRGGGWGSRHVSLLFCGGSSSGSGWCGGFSGRCGGSSTAAWLCGSGLAAGLRSSSYAAAANDHATAWLRFSGLAARLSFCLTARLSFCLAARLSFCLAAGLSFAGRGWCRGCFCGYWSSRAAGLLCGTAATGFSRAGEHKSCQQCQQCHVTHCVFLF